MSEVRETGFRFHTDYDASLEFYSEKNQFIS